jgi:hypothetical protein
MASRGAPRREFASSAHTVPLDLRNAFQENVATQIRPRNPIPQRAPTMFETDIPKYQYEFSPKSLFPLPRFPA